MKPNLTYVLLLVIGLLGGFLVRFAPAQTPGQTPASAPATPPMRFQGVTSTVMPVAAAGDPAGTYSKHIGVQVYQDTANGNLIYLTETGSIAVVAAPAAAAK